MIRDLVLKERRLDWNIKDAWELLCKFLGKYVPSEEFLSTNSGAG